MPGALTANAVTVRLDGAVANVAEVPIADIQFLSPVEGANNVLLTGIVMVTESDAIDELTVQWYRTGPSVTLADDPLITAVGDPFIIDCGDSELILSPLVVQAIDRGTGLTSAYALAISSTEEKVTVEALYADAVLYD